LGQPRSGVRFLITALLAGSAVLLQAAESFPPPLTTAQQVLALGLDTARQSFIPVRLQGLITYPEPAANLLYVQDYSAGIRVFYTNTDFEPVSGQTVIVEGTAAGGMFAPFVDCANVRVIGSSSIPEPCEAPAARMVA